MMQGEHEQPLKARWVKKAPIIIASIIFIVAVAAAVFFFLQYNAVRSNPGVVSQERTDRLKEKVSKLYAIPSETPTVAEISKKEKLQDQAFFKEAENGDILFIFPNTKLALLYREAANKLINVGPISLSDKTDSKSQSK